VPREAVQIRRAVLAALFSVPTATGVCVRLALPGVPFAVFATGGGLPAFR